MKRAALHELIEFVTATGSSSQSSGNNANNNNNTNGNNKDGDKRNDDPNETPNMSMLSTNFEPTFYEEMVNTVRDFNPLP